MQKLTINIPEGVPTPAFSLFQKVRRKSKNSRCKCNRVGTITGMNYICFLTALKLDDEMGWVYYVDWIFNASQAKALSVSDPQEIYYEDLLEAVEEG